MSTFALDSNSSDEDKVSALNYVLSNLGQGGTSANTANVLTANVTTGVVSTQGTTVSYLYQYMNVAYANTAVGGGFSSNSANKLYYGIHNNTANVADTNPADYQWTQVSGGGFGTTKSLYYQTLGGRQIFFNVATSSPGYYFRSVQDNVPINLDDVTSTQTIYTAQVYQRGNVTPATPTGGTYNFGNLFLTPPTGWYSNVPPADGNTYVFTSQNTFQSSQAFINPPTKAWTFPTLFTANGGQGAAGANGAPGTNGISTYDFTAYTLTSFLPNTPLVNTGSWSFSTGTGTPPLDPNYIYTPYILPASTITTQKTYNGVPNSTYTGNVVNIYSNTVANVMYPSITNTYYTFYANTYSLGNVPSGYAAYTSATTAYTSVGNAYVDHFTVTGNTAYVDLMLIAGGQASSYVPGGAGNAYAGSPGGIRVYSNVALTVGNYNVIHGPGVSTTITGPGGTWTAPFQSPANSYFGNATSGSTAIVNGVSVPGGSTYTYNGVDQGGAGFPDPWVEITWIGEMAGTYTWPNGTPWSGANVAYFGGGGGGGLNWPGGSGTYNLRGYGGLGSGPIISQTKAPNGAVGGSFGSWLQPAPPNPYTEWSGSKGLPGTGAGGGQNWWGGMTESTYNYAYPNPGGFATALNSNGLAGGSGAAIIRKHNAIVNPPQVATWTVYNNQNPTPTQTVYSSTSLAFTTNANANVSTLAWQPTVQSSGYMGDAGPRGFVPMAYVATASDPTSYTTGQYTYAFSANRANVALPIGTGYVPTQGDTAQFVYTPTNTIVVKEYNQTANVWTQVNGQVISGNVFVTGSVNATALNANDVYTLNLRGGLGVVGNVNSPGFWMQASTGDARMAGNTSIGNNLTVGNNAVVGNNLTIGASAAIGNNLLVGNNAIVGSSMAIGNNLIVGLNAQVGANLNVGTNAVIGNNLSIGNNAVVGNNFGVGNIAVIGNNLTVGNNAIIGSSLAIGDNLQVGNNATIGANLNVGSNATIGNNLIVGDNAVVGNSFGVGNNAVIGNSLTVGNNAVIGSSVAIGNNLNIGNNAVIGGNLAVAGLVTAGNLQANTVQTTTITPSSVTTTGAVEQATGYTINNPSMSFAGITDGYYQYASANLIPYGASITATTLGVTNIISGAIDVYGYSYANNNYVPTLYAFLIRYIGASPTGTVVGGSELYTPAYNIIYGGSATISTGTLQSIRLPEVGILDQFTLASVPATISYYWVFGSAINLVSNTAPVVLQPNLSYYSQSLTVTNYKR